MSINILDSSVFNRIAAGEVVENPRSIVKELVENSIDAGADSIIIEIRGGGISYISVSDNGKGLVKEDMPRAFLPHATSKIKTLKDLEAISSLGFRGEALPSIASVADVEMVSRTAGSELGYKVVLEGGKIIDEGECGTPYGTRVTVRNLFATIPARAKFLRKPISEEGTITEYIIKCILSNPYLTIKYVIDGEVKFQSDGKGINSAVYTVYGEDFLNNMCEITCTTPGITLNGLICRPNYTKHNRTYQTLIVNGRYIVNQELSYCIQQCYAEYLMKRQFPAYVLYLNMPADMLDVNVHPNKLDVRFAAEKQLKGFVYNAIKTKVDELATAPIDFVATPKADPAMFEVEIDEPPKVTVEDKPSSRYSDPALFSPRAYGQSRVAEAGIAETPAFGFIKSLTFSENEPGPVEEKSVEHKQARLFDETEEIHFAGKLFNTYLLVESGEYCYAIDQHAAHEKILYDKLVGQVDSGNSVIQDLLVPYIFDVSPSEKSSLIDALPQINSYGFKIDHLNAETFTLYALPACCVDMNLEKFVSLILADVDAKKQTSDFIKENLMQAACKSAVKGEEDLSKSEVYSLLDQMRSSGSARFCPHGRPTVIRFAKADLEKIFKRKV